jgi:antitoxin component of RelBE/YafQ-DinJ toxin-antitoxin module
MAQILRFTVSDAFRLLMFKIAKEKALPFAPLRKPSRR